MDTKLLRREKSIKENEKVAFRNKALIFGFFLAVSFTFWLINALSKYYTTEISYPVKYINAPNQKVQVGAPPDKLQIKVRALGYTIFRHNLRAKYSPIVFSVNSFSMKRLPGKDSAFFFLQTVFARDYISAQLSNEFEILEIKPDTLVFRFANMRSGKIPVKPAFTFQLEKQMILKGDPVLRPDSIDVSGPDYIMDTLSYVNTMDTNLGLISKKRDFVIKMEEAKNLLLKTNEIRVTIDVEQFTEKTINIPISVANMPDNLNIQSFPPSIRLTCQVGLSNFEKLDASYFRAQVDYGEILKSESGRVKVSLTVQPTFVKAVNFSPAYVEYLIER